MLPARHGAGKGPEGSIRKRRQQKRVNEYRRDTWNKLCRGPRGELGREGKAEAVVVETRECECFFFFMFFFFFFFFSG
jgi:hypothetical protein